MWCVFLVLALAGCSVTGQKRNFSVKPIEEVVKDFGYPIERHEIPTEDGYILNYHRVPHGRNNTAKQQRKVVFFSNGILLSSASTLTARGGFAYALADAGYDVWLGNYRGNMYSRNHKTLNPDKDREFWDFSFHEFGTFDLPASIDYILSHTGQQQLIYIGASMGTTMFWVLGSNKPEYMDKIEAMIAIAPVARPSHGYLFRNWVRYYALLTALSTLQTLDYNEVFPYSETRGVIIYYTCTTQWLKPVCYQILQAYSFFTGQHWDIDRVLENFKYGPAGISTKVIRHFMQVARAERFQYYDYGPDKNYDRYQSVVPPLYNLKNVTCKSIYFIHSDADQVATREDVEWLAEELPMRPKRIIETVNHLGHLELGLDKNIRELLILPLIDFILKQFPD